MKTVAVFLLFLGGAWAHMCMISPPQRGSMMGINKAGADDCALVTGPCGGRMAMRPAISLMAGDNFTVTIQKNLDHYSASTPGMFTINMMEGEHGQFKQMAMIKDMGEPSLSLYTANITVPRPMGHGHAMATLQAVYVTMNPQAPAMFYECADVMIMSPP